ncbi:MAG: deoxyribonuclease IV [Candidatus Omnitrophica bacterium]|nr:deoxyribonuclease IV [Candidatus Omnitrophota bacterium]
MKIGAHIWIGAGLKKAAEMAVNLGCECIQIFLHNPRSWKIFPRSNYEMANFAKFLKKKDIQPLAIHMPYLVNLASSDKEILRLSIKRLEIELEESEKIGASFYIVHPGSNTSKIGGLKQISKILRNFESTKTKILIENTAGQGNTIGGSWEDFGYIFQNLKNFGVCFDTAHAFVSGNDFRKKHGFEKMLREMEKYFPLNLICIVHANDTLSESGSKTDRHQHLGKGLIGVKGFKNLLNDKHFSTLPFIIETPKGSLEDDRKNLNWLSKLWD